MFPQPKTKNIYNQQFINLNEIPAESPESVAGNDKRLKIKGYVKGWGNKWVRKCAFLREKTTFVSPPLVKMGKQENYVNDCNCI